ncbi:NAD-dependent succinate-semialdehyde dehydrogenase [Sciscionella marina]|uniref:NAD-dependent succinate-semialdehyde dehydrogenase n=1 Tax=Sciscionella marina TaxID=508770 RepID=UPI000362CF58|nr:NAD-dependent succinate-semialdehyde dehydrogenase [Sciscionella marina]
MTDNREHARNAVDTFLSPHRPLGAWIDNEWRATAGAGSFDVLDPATDETITTVSAVTPGEARKAVDAAAAALPTWAQRPPRARAEVLRAAYELMQQHRDELAALISWENGKAIADARAEVTYAAEFFRWYSEEAVRLTGTIGPAPGGGNHLVTALNPVGVAALITPWNFPAAMATRKIGPALAAGCTAVLKPAAQTPLTALALACLLERAGAPPGVVNVIPTSDPGPVVSALLDDARVRKISFTGSTAVGRRLLAQAADRVLASSMELGGNAPFIVCADADLDAALDGAMIAKMRNGGQACTAANRFYVHDDIADEFVAGLARRLQDLVIGPGLDEYTDFGPLIDKRARDNIRALVDSTLAAGATLVTGETENQGKGWYIAPTILDHVPTDAAILHTEIFGPVAPIVRFTNERDAVTQANDTEYGLASYVYARDVSKAIRLGQRLETGMVGINRGLLSDPAAPFGGAKQSGLGREGGHEGVLDYTETQYLAVAW